MGSPSCGQEEQTLGAYLVRLRPGDSCPCCGARMQETGHPLKQRDRRGGIVCIDCGCSLTEVDFPFQTETRWVLSTAA